MLLVVRSAMADAHRDARFHPQSIALGAGMAAFLMRPVSWRSCLLGHWLGVRATVQSTTAPAVKLSSVAVIVLAQSEDANTAILATSW